MRVLLDENLNWRLRRALGGHEIATVQSLGWSGTKNGKLLRKAIEAGFNALVTMDGSLVHQQNLSSLDIAVLVLKAPSNRLKDTVPLMPALLRILPKARKGRKTLIG